MKFLIIILFFLGAVPVCRAQTFDEWFRQNSTRLKYYAQQIAALQTYIGLAEKGYGIVESGLNTIGELKKGEFDLHNTFYTSLGTVDPTIGGMAEVAEIMAIQAAIVNRFSTALGRYRKGPGIGAGEMTYMGQVYSLMVTDGLADLDALTAVITSDTLKMTDDERMARIRGLDAGVKDRYAFTIDFTNRADMLMLNRQRQEADAGTLKGLYGLP